MEKRAEPLRWPCPTEQTSRRQHALPRSSVVVRGGGVAGRGQKGKRFLTPSGKVEIDTPELEQKLAAAGHRALPVFYTHPEVTGRNPTIEYSAELVNNPVNPQALTPKVTIGGVSPARFTRNIR